MAEPGPDDRMRNAYAPPKASAQRPAQPVPAGKNPAHTAIFGALFLLLVLGLPLLFGGFFGLLFAPIAGAALWGLYVLTLPGGPRGVPITETAGNEPCPACGSMQTDRIRFVMDPNVTRECFSCAHTW